MATIDPTTLTPFQLAGMLRAWARGLYSCEAAVELLISHGVWLRRRAFLSACVEAIDDGWTGCEPEPMARIDFAAALDLLDRPNEAFADIDAVDPASYFFASSSEQKILCLAASLSGNVSRAWPLSDLIPGLDEANTGLLLEAIAHTAGWHEHHLSRQVTGHLPPDPKAVGR